MTTQAKAIINKAAREADTDWNIAFWFAVLSPILGVLVGFLALLVLVR
jgi:hypothetical protein